MANIACNGILRFADISENPDVIYLYTDNGDAQKKGQEGQKAIRLDVLKGIAPAEKLYSGLDFKYLHTLKMFYEDTGWTDYELYEYTL